MRFHIGSLIMAICGLAALIPGLMTLLGYGHWIHRLLDQPLGAIALLVIGGSCLLAAFFPLLAAHLTRRENERHNSQSSPNKDT
ncbi:hypothetical protein L1281_002208 [Neisseria sp. HSC-16F19]|nr:hypothetical protein [Neisseria sp. HSC-16F19]MCP2041599.1 hypothetical protein [Neisseria sp. HSC-16F19]